MRILVFGNRGYIGSVLTDKLLKTGHYVGGYDADFFRNCDYNTLPPDPSKQTIKDIRLAEIEDLEGYEAVIHLANISNDVMGTLNEDLTYAINYEATVRLAELAKKAKVKRFIYSSTQSVYGNSEGEVVTESTKVKPLTAYARSKYMSEQEISKLVDDTFTPIFMRPTTVCGVSPRMRTDLLINAMVANAVTEKKIYVYSSHKVWRASLHIDDVTNAFITVLQAKRDLVSNEVFNVGGNADNHTTTEIAHLVNTGVPKAKLIFTNQLGKDTRSYKSNYDKIISVITDFKPKWNTKDCINELSESFEKSQITQEEVTNKFNRLKVLKTLLETGKIDPDLYFID